MTSAKRLADPQRRVRGEQLVLAHEPGQDRDPRGPEEDRDRRQEERRADRPADVESRPRSASRSTIAARRMSLTTRTSRWSQRSTRVPAIGPNNRLGSVAATKTSGDRDRRVGQDEHDRRDGDLVDAVAEQRDQLAGPQCAERAVEREADVRVAAETGEDIRGEPGDRDRRRVAVASGRRATGRWRSEPPDADGRRRGRSAAGAPRTVRRPGARPDRLPLAAPARRRGGAEARRPPPPRSTGRDADDAGEQEERRGRVSGTGRRASTRSG